MTIPPRSERVAAALAETSRRLQWNVTAYGKAWTGEEEDTEFIAEGFVEALAAAEAENQQLREFLGASA